MGEKQTKTRRNWGMVQPAKEAGSVAGKLGIPDLNVPEADDKGPEVATVENPQPQLAENPGAIEAPGNPSELAPADLDGEGASTPAGIPRGTGTEPKAQKPRSVGRPPGKKSKKTVVDSAAETPVGDPVGEPSGEAGAKTPGWQKGALRTIEKYRRGELDMTTPIRRTVEIPAQIYVDILESLGNDLLSKKLSFDDAIALGLVVVSEKLKSDIKAAEEKAKKDENSLEALQVKLQGLAKG